MYIYDNIMIFYDYIVIMGQSNMFNPPSNLLLLFSFLYVFRYHLYWRLFFFLFFVLCVLEQKYSKVCLKILNALRRAQYVNGIDICLTQALRMCTTGSSVCYDVFYSFINWIVDPARPVDDIIWCVDLNYFY